MISMEYNSKEEYKDSISFGDLKSSEDKLDSDILTDRDIVSLSSADGFPMTDFQVENFVIGDAITDYRKKRQALLEVDVRRQSLHSITKSLKLAKAQLALVERDILNESDELKRNLLECEADDLRYDIEVWETKEPQARRELQTFINQFRSFIPENATIEEVRKIGLENPQLEEEYWVTRMAKQTAVDLISYGRIGSGNLSSVMQMDVDSQKVIIEKALEYSTRFEQTTQALGSDIARKLLGTEPKNTIPLVQSIVEEDIYDEPIQLTSKPKVKSESV